MDYFLWTLKGWNSHRGNEICVRLDEQGSGGGAGQGAEDTWVQRRREWTLPHEKRAGK